LNNVKTKHKNHDFSYRYFQPESEEELKAMHVLSRTASSEFMTLAEDTNVPVGLEKLDYFRNYTNFTVTNYMNAKGWQFGDNTDLFYCRYK